MVVLKNPSNFLRDGSACLVSCLFLFCWPVHLNVYFDGYSPTVINCPIVISASIQILNVFITAPRYAVVV